MFDECRARVSVDAPHNDEPIEVLPADGLVPLVVREKDTASLKPQALNFDGKAALVFYAEVESASLLAAVHKFRRPNATDTLGILEEKLLCKATCA
jgi:hypothetical protein